MSGSGAIQPITAYQAPDVLGQAGQVAGLQNQLLGNQTAQQNLQLQQYALRQDQLAQTQNRLNLGKSVLAPLLRLGPNVQPSDVYTALKGLSSVPGAPTDEIAADVAATMPVKDVTQANNPAYQKQYGQQLQSWIQNQAGSTLTPEAQYQAFTPNVAMINRGGVITPIDVNPNTNPGVTGQSLPLTLSPGEAVSGQNFTTPSGTPYFESNAQIANQTGQGNLVAGGGGGGGAPAGNSIFGNGRLPGRGPAYNGPQAGSAAPSAPATGGGSGIPPNTIQTGLPPGVAAGADVAGAGSANDLHSLYSTVSTSGGRLYQLNQALTSLQALGKTGTGPGTAEFNNLKSYLQSSGVAGVLDIDPSKIANFDEATKYLTAYASNQAENSGAGTDSKLATALSSNASTHISNLAAVNVVKATIGLERMQQAEAAAFSATGLPASSYDQWSTTWNKTADARAYAFDLMTPQQRGSVLSGMTGSARTSFINQVWTAAQNGFVDGGKLGFTSAAPAPAAAAPPPGQVPNPAAPGQTYQPAVPTGP